MGINTTIILNSLGYTGIQKGVYMVNLCCVNRVFKLLHYKAASQNLTLGFNCLVVCYCDALEAGPHISHDTWLIQVKKPAEICVMRNKTFLLIKFS
jgi:hypothetical protein